MGHICAQQYNLQQHKCVKHRTSMAMSMVPDSNADSSAASGTWPASSSARARNDSSDSSPSMLFVSASFTSASNLNATASPFVVPALR